MRVRDGFDRWFLDRALAGTGRAGAWSRSEARRRQYQYIRERRKGLLSLIALSAALLPFLLLLPGWSRSFAAGAFVASIGWLVTDLVLLRSGTAALVMGEAGEIWTAEELRRLRRRRWRVINRVVLGWGDIDHVALGPGGVVVLETKWSAAGWPDDDDSRQRIDAAVDQVIANAGRVRGFVRPELGAAPVHVAVVLWGPDAVDPDFSRGMRSGVAVLRGVELRQWLASVVDEGVDSRAVDVVWRRFAAQIERREANDELRFGAPPKGVGHYVEMGWQLVLGALFGFLAAAATLSLLGWKLYLPAALVLASGGLAIRRIRRVQWFAYAWIAGSQTVSLLILGALLVDWLRPH